MVEAVRPPTLTRASPCISSPLLPYPIAIGIMDTMVVRVVMRIGRSLVAPASIIAVRLSIVERYWLTVST